MDEANLFQKSNFISSGFENMSDIILEGAMNYE
jgi:hypothetical protein